MTRKYTKHKHTDKDAQLETGGPDLYRVAKNAVDLDNLLRPDHEVGEGVRLWANDGGEAVDYLRYRLQEAEALARRPRDAR